VKAGLRNARAKGKRLGRPRKVLDTERIAALRAQGVGWTRIAAEKTGRLPLFPPPVCNASTPIGTLRKPSERIR
jgi:hypothetical protein